MNAGVDISIQKLSAPLEVLNLDRRACRGMRRAGFYTVAEIVLAGKPRLQAGKNIGILTVSRVLEAVATYLGVPEDELVGENLPKPGSFSDPWAAPVRALPLSASTLHWLESAGLFRVEELVKARPTGYDKFRALEKKQIYDIDRALSWYLARAAQLQLLSSVGSNAILELPVMDPQPVPDPGSMLQSPRLDERVQTYSIPRTFLPWSDGGPMP